MKIQNLILCSANSYK